MQGSPSTAHLPVSFLLSVWEDALVPSALNGSLRAPWESPSLLSGRTSGDGAEIAVCERPTPDAVSPRPHPMRVPLLVAGVAVDVGHVWNTRPARRLMTAMFTRAMKTPSEDDGRRPSSRACRTIHPDQCFRHSLVCASLVAASDGQKAMPQKHITPPPCLPRSDCAGWRRHRTCSRASCRCRRCGSGGCTPALRTGASRCAE